MKILDPPAVRRWARLAADALGRARTEIDALNVFPVADGDTGTNLHLTLLSAAEAVESLPEDVDAAVVWQTLSYGALVGARGNSGVIVSQALRGLAEVLKDGEDLRAGLLRAAVLAREAVARPVEGTVLSVLESAALAVQGVDGDLPEVARQAAGEARAALRRTPGQLDVLARSGVVDAGGAGAAIVLETLAAVITGSHADHYEVPALLAAIRQAGAEVAVLPNDEGVRAVAAAAAEIAREDGVVVSVLPTKATVQGLAALAVHDPLRRFDDDVVAMTDAAGHTRYGHVTVADREAFTSAGVCRPGDVLGLIDGDVAVIGDSVGDVAVTVVDRMVAGGGELVTLVTGERAPHGLAGLVEDHLGRTRPGVDLAVYDGEQGGYPVLIGVE